MYRSPSIWTDTSQLFVLSCMQALQSLKEHVLHTRVAVSVRTLVLPLPSPSHMKWATSESPSLHIFQLIECSKFTYYSLTLHPPPPPLISSLPLPLFLLVLVSVTMATCQHPASQTTITSWLPPSPNHTTLIIGPPVAESNWLSSCCKSSYW